MSLWVAPWIATYIWTALFCARASNWTESFLWITVFRIPNFLWKPYERTSHLYQRQACPQSQATISVFDSGFNFGDSVFEGMRVYNGRVQALDEHMDRLYSGERSLH